MAQPFDEKALAIAGPAVQVTQHVGSFRDGGLFAVSANDRLIYRTAAADMQLAWVDRRGAVSARISEPGGVLGASLSPDGTRAVVSRIDPQDTAKADLWLLDLAGGGAKRFTFGAGIAEFPLWSPDGTQIVFTVNKSLLHRKPANGEGSETLVLKSSGGGGVIANGWSSDGRFLLYSVLETMTTKSDLWVWPTNGGEPIPFLRSEFHEGEGRFSPDRRWVAYVSNESGANEVYVRTFAEDISSGSATRGGSVLVSRGGGSAPRWRADGRQLFYASNDGKMMAVEVSTGATFHAETPATMFRIPLGASIGDLSPDAQRFLSVVPAGATAMTPFTVVLNWTAGLKK